jgi:hypothetical protein
LSTGDVEKPLDLVGVQIDGQDTRSVPTAPIIFAATLAVIGTPRRTRAAILAGVAEIGHHRGDAGRRWRA